MLFMSLLDIVIVINRNTHLFMYLLRRSSRKFLNYCFCSSFSIFCSLAERIGILCHVKFLLYIQVDYWAWHGIFVLGRCEAWVRFIIIWGLRLLLLFVLRASQRLTFRRWQNFIFHILHGFWFYFFLWFGLWNHICGLPWWSLIW